MSKNEIRDRILSSGVAAAKRYDELQGAGLNPPAAVFVGGGLTLIEDKHGIRFGSSFSPNVVVADKLMVDRWNQANPNHMVKIAPLQDVLVDDCMQILSLLGRITEKMS